MTPTPAATSGTAPPSLSMSEEQQPNNVVQLNIEEEAADRCQKCRCTAFKCKEAAKGACNGSIIGVVPNVITSLPLMIYAAAQSNMTILICAGSTAGGCICTGGVIGAIYRFLNSPPEINETNEPQQSEEQP